jgi:hypothetical protein
MVLDQRGDWIFVQDAETGRPLWIHLGPAHQQARQMLPEFGFAQALAAYLGYRQVADPDTAADIRRLLSDFRRGLAGSPGDARQSRPLAMASALEGALQMPQFRLPGDGSDSSTARQKLDDALLEMPDHSALLNLSAMSRLYDCCANAAAVRDIHERFERARNLDVSNTTVARNLLQWYRHIDSLDDSLLPLPRQELRIRRAELEALLGH